MIRAGIISSSSSSSEPMLSEAEQATVCAGWAKISQNKIQLGQEIFLTMFDQFPKHQELFSDFKGRNRAELQVSPKLKAHGLRVVNALDGAVQNLQDVEICTEVLHLIGCSHKRHHVTVQHFEDLSKTLTAVLQQKLGSDFDENREAWSKFLKVIIPAIQQGIRS